MAGKMRTYVATAADHDVILELTNEAFMADAFFKKKEYHLRFDRPTVEAMMTADNSRFILAAETKDGVDVPCGSIFMHWEVSRTDTETLVTGKFSAVSVPTRFGKRGIGKSLVHAAESQLCEIAKSVHAEQPTKDLVVNMEMGVINQRKDLFPWYEGQGYKIIGEIRPNDEELLRICLDDMDICCILMRKRLL